MGPRTRASEREPLIAAAAHLRASGFVQTVIAARLGISQAEVSRLLNAARLEGWLAETPQFKMKDEKVWRAAERRYFSVERTRASLQARYQAGGSLLHRVTLIDILPSRRIDPASARVVATMLGKARYVGVTWGPTIGRLVEALRELRYQAPFREMNRRIDFVPLCGEPLGDPGDPGHDSSSALAKELTTEFNSGDRPTPPPSIAGVPAFIPLQFRDGIQLETIRRFIRGVRGYANVFGATGQPWELNGAGKQPGGGPLASKLDAILTSVGTAADRLDRGIFLKERINCGDITESDLERTCVGDVGGVIIRAAGISAEEGERIDAMNDRWTGIRIDHLQQCAKAAMEEGFRPEKPGVLMLAAGARRRNVVLRCVELGLVSELIIDHELNHTLVGE